MRRTKLSDDVADRLKANILSGKFAFGEKLPAERDLARFMSVGRQTLREALSMLSTIGLVEVRHGEGVFVISNHRDFLAKAFGSAFLLTSGTVREIVDARSAIETGLAELAAARASAGDVERLNGLLSSMADSLGRPRRFAAADLEFHLAVAACSENRILTQLLSATRALLERWISRALEVDGTDALALEQHRIIASAIADHRPSEAGRAMREHLRSMGERLEAQLGTEDTGDADWVTGPSLDGEDRS